jgi:hypothetical protein
MSLDCELESFGFSQLLVISLTEKSLGLFKAPRYSGELTRNSLKKPELLASDAWQLDENIFLGHGLAAADINRLAGDALGLIRGKITNQLGDFIGL